MKIMGDSVLKYIDGQMISQAMFFVFGLLAVVSAAYLLFTKNLIHGAYSLFVTLFSVAALFVFAGSDFLAVSQIMVYIGGILVMMIFAIMLTYKKNDGSNKTTSVNKIEINSQNIFFGGAIMLMTLGGFIKAIIESNFHIVSKIDESKSSIRLIGINLMTNYVFPFEVVGVLLLVTLIGSTYIAKSSK